MDGDTLRVEEALEDTATAPLPQSTEWHALNRIFTSFELRLTRLEGRLTRKYETSESAPR